MKYIERLHQQTKQQSNGVLTEVAKKNNENLEDYARQSVKKSIADTKMELINRQRITENYKNSDEFDIGNLLTSIAEEIKLNTKLSELKKLEKELF